MKKIEIEVISKFIFALIFICLVFFLPAGSLSYWQAWIYICAIFIPFVFVVRYLLKNDPGLIKRRMNFREKEVKQKKIIKISTLIFLIGFLTPGFDFRLGWSSVPIWLIMLSDILVFIGYLLVFSVFKENSYASRIIEVEKGQKVVTTGPYSLVRHPMYFGIILMFLFTPLALGSYWALIPFSLTIPFIILRLLNEEEVLKRDLKGYKKYCEKTRHRLIPFIW